MTGKSFRRDVVITIVVLLVVSALTLFVGVRWPEIGTIKVGDATRSAIPAFVAAAAGWLAFCLQRRIAYIKALHDLWIRLVAAVQDTIQYTHLDPPDQTKFGSIMRDLSCRTDEIRGVFRNVGELYREPASATKNFVAAIRNAKTIEEYAQIVASYTKDPAYKARRKLIGVYPFESLRQMQDTITRLGFAQQATKERRDIARGTILLLWAVLRAEMLKELDRDYPEFPDTPYAP